MDYEIKKKRELPVKCKVFLLNALTYTEKAKDIYNEDYERFFIEEDNSEIEVPFLSQLKLNQCLLIAQENIFNLYNYCNMRNYRKPLIKRLEYLLYDFEILNEAVEDFKLVKDEEIYKENTIQLLREFEMHIENVKLGIEDIVYNRI